MCLVFPAGETVTSHGSIEPDKDQIREEPYSLPQGFSWDTLDLGNPGVVRKGRVSPTGLLPAETFRKLFFSNQLKELYTLLNENYVEDDDNMFRFDYSPDFLLW